MYDFNNPTILRYRKDIKQYKPNNAQLNIELAKQYQQTKDERILNKLITGNLAIAFKLATGYHNIVDVDNAIAIANVALMRCVKKYNPDSGFKFSTLLATYIQNEMLTFCRKNGSTVRFDKYIQKKDKVAPIMISTGQTIANTDFTIGDNLPDPYDRTEFEFILSNDEFWNIVTKELNRLFPGRRDGLSNTEKMEIIKEIMLPHRDRTFCHDELGEVYGCTRQNLSQSCKLVFKHLQGSDRLKELYEQLE